MSIKSIILATTLMFATGVSAADMRTVESNYGPIEVPVAPQRVYVDSPWILGNVIALGVIPVGTVGFSEGSVDYMGDAAKKVPQFQWNVSIEKIATLNPDIIFISEWNVGDEEERCTAAANVTATFCSMGAKYTIEIVQNNLLMVADALNKTEKAKELIATMNERIASLKARVLAAGLDKKTVSIMRVRPDTYEFAGPMAPVMIQSVGLTVPKGQFAPYPRPDDFDWSGTEISLENLDKAQADYLFINVDLDNNGALEALQNNPLFPTLPSVKNNQVFLVETGVWNSFDILANNTVLDQIEKLIIEPAEKS